MHALLPSFLSFFAAGDGWDGMGKGMRRGMDIWFWDGREEKGIWRGEEEEEGGRTLNLRMREAREQA